jgi:hypothetical protein
MQTAYQPSTVDVAISYLEESEVKFQLPVSMWSTYLVGRFYDLYVDTS